jgi:DNA adenine methylase
LFLNRTKRSGILRGGVIGGKEQVGDYKLDCRFTRKELVRKIRRIAEYREQIKLFRLDAAEFLATRVPSLPMRALVNIDPPYYRQGPDLYCSFYTHDDHVALARLIRQIEQPWILTYDDADPRRKIYVRRKVHELSLMFFAQVKRIGVELLYTSSGLKLPHEQAA